MPGQYQLSASPLINSPTSIKTVSSASNATTTTLIKDNNNVFWCASADNSSNQISFFPLSGTDGIITNSVIAGATISAKTVGSSPSAVALIKDNNNVFWCASPDSQSSQISFFPLSSTDGIITNSVIAGATVTSKTVGFSPSAVALIKDNNNVFWCASADAGSDQISFFPLSSTDGIIANSVIASATVTSKTVGLYPVSLALIKDNNNVFWCASLDSNSIRISFFPLSSTDGIISASVIASAAVTSKAFGLYPFSLALIKDSNNIFWCASADNSSNLVYFFPISASDGIISASVITSAAVTSKTVGLYPISLALIKDSNNIFWCASADNNEKQISFFPLSGTDGIITNSVIAGATVISKTTVNVQNSVSLIKDSNNIFWCASAVAGFFTPAVIKLFAWTPLKSSYDVARINNSYWLIANEVAQVDSEIDSFDFVSGIAAYGVSGYLYGLIYTFAYTGDPSSPGTLGIGSTLRLTTVTADVTGLDLTLASGSTLRLGKKASYQLRLTAQSGSTIEVYPDSDRANAPVNLRSFTINSGITINAVSGTAAVLVNSTNGVTAGAGVTLQVPQASIRFFGIPNVSNSIISVQDLTTSVITYPTIVAGEVTVTVNTARNYRIRAKAPGYLASRFFTIPGTTPEFQFSLTDYRSLYLSGVNRSSQISFNATTFVITITDATLALSFADVFRTIEDYLASQQGLAYTAHPFPIVLPSKNLLWFPFDTTANAVNPARIKPAITNTLDPELLFETYLEGATDTTYGLFDFTGAGGRIIRIRSEVAIAQVSGDGSFTASDRVKLEEIKTNTSGSDFVIL